MMIAMMMIIIIIIALYKANASSFYLMLLLIRAVVVSFVFTHSRSSMLTNLQLQLLLPIDCGYSCCCCRSKRC